MMNVSRVVIGGSSRLWLSAPGHVEWWWTLQFTHIRWRDYQRRQEWILEIIMVQSC